MPRRRGISVAAIHAPTACPHRCTCLPPPRRFHPCTHLPPPRRWGHSHLGQRSPPRGHRI